MKCLTECFKGTFIKHSLHGTAKKYIPILSWIEKYNIQDFKGDFIAGFTVGLTVVPQGLALAQLVNLPPQYGLFTALMGSFMYAIFGTCKDLVIGPTSVMALMTAEYALIGGPVYVTILSFLCGCIQLLLGIFNLGFLMNFISAPVLSGFTSSAAIIIATSQLKGIFGLEFKSRGFPSTVYNFFLNISLTNIYDLAMGITSIFLLILLKTFKDKKLTCCKWSLGSQRAMQSLWWLLATARNAILVILCSVTASTLSPDGKDLFTLTQHVEAGLPAFRPPQFTLSYFDQASNTTIFKDTGEIFKDLGSGAVIIPFLSLLEAIAIAKTFSRGVKLDATREMVALGMGNLMGSFVGAYPVTGSFSRSVINSSSGVRTPFGGAISGILVLLALGVLAPSFHYIPKSCLCSIIFSAVIFMIHYEDIPAMWKVNKLELIPFSGTFFGSMAFGLEYGLLFGIAIALAILLYKQNTPSISTSIRKAENGHTFIHFHPENSIYFPSSDYFKGVVSKTLYSHLKSSECTIIIELDNVMDIDYTTAMGLKNMVEGLKKDKVRVAFKITDSSSKTMKCLEEFALICRKEHELESFIKGIEDCKLTPETIDETESNAEHLLAINCLSVDVDCLSNAEENIGDRKTTA